MFVTFWHLDFVFLICKQETQVIIEFLRLLCFCLGQWPKYLWTDPENTEATEAAYQQDRWSDRKRTAPTGTAALVDCCILLLYLTYSAFSVFSDVFPECFLDASLNYFFMLLR